MPESELVGCRLRVVRGCRFLRLLWCDLGDACVGLLSVSSIKRGEHCVISTRKLTASAYKSFCKQGEMRFAYSQKRPT